MEQKLQRINSRLNNIEYILCCICNKLDKVESEDLTILSLLGKIIKDIEGTQNSINTANTNINTANDGMSTANTGIDNANGGVSLLSLGLGTANQGMSDANDAIANINCGSCDLKEVNDKLDEIIDNIPSMKCKYKKNDEEISSKTTKAKRYDD